MYPSENNTDSILIFDNVLYDYRNMIEVYFNMGKLIYLTNVKFMQNFQDIQSEIRIIALLFLNKMM